VEKSDFAPLNLLKGFKRSKNQTLPSGGGLRGFTPVKSGKDGKLLKYNLILYSSIKYGEKVYIGKP
jgi:hypothetical protein